MTLDLIPRLTSPRIPPLDAGELTDEQRRLTLGASVVIQTLARRDELLRAWITFAGGLLSDSPLDGRQRELVILRVAMRTRCAYEWANHSVAAQMYGLSTDEVRSLATTTDPTGWGESDTALLSVVDDLCADDAVSDRTWTALRRTLDESAILSLIAVVGFYRMTASLLNGVGVQPEHGLPQLGEPFVAEASTPPPPPTDAPAPGPARVTGRWAVTFRHPAGDQRLTLELADHDETLTGTVANPAIGLTVDLEDGTAHDGHITGVTRLTTPFAMTLSWDGTVIDDTISGHVAVSGAGGTYPFDGTRTD